jgi:hypothetical protein
VNPHYLNIKMIFNTKASRIPLFFALSVGSKYPTNVVLPVTGTSTTFGAVKDDSNE